MRQDIKLRRFYPVWSLALLLSGCMVGPDYVSPATETATQWLEAEDKRLKTTSSADQSWWKTFNDPVLNQLVERAYLDNLNIRVAGVRVLEARAQLGVAIGDFYPQNQQLIGSLNKVHLSERASQAAFSRIFDYAQTQLGFTAGWELDFWGKYRRAIESADAGFQAAVADYNNALVTLTADVAHAYVTIRTLEKRLSIAKQNVDTQQENLNIAKIRYNGGTTSERDVEQARTVLANTQASIPTLAIGLRQQQNALSVLLGMPPNRMNGLLSETAQIPSPPLRVAVGIPAELLRRRPDVRHAEWQAAAQSASIGVTKAALYPAISLTGTFGLLSSDVGSFSLGDVFLWKSRTANFGPALQWNIFNYGQITNQVRVQDARLQELLVNYQNTVLTAQREVEDNLVAFLRSQERAQALGESTAAAQRSLDLATLQYRQGITDFTTVLTAQQALLSEQDNLASTLGDIANNLVGVYRALGGGWQVREGNDVVPDAIKEQMEKRTDWGGLLRPSAQPSPDNETPTGVGWPRW
ncbi:efflux transporter outer membrane subunit [Candidatus Methylobacter oryzae]|uniref:Efflux transporter outer membrane subunit n=1 Tax=Candidatus Methylobacter oryzae TaxID=2497749 RepID=A0ABY3C6I8_9GAMM|nr:efflux transporter outer membrane subunit [Candidatus Methylobacter oryzae]TRW91198.1 efflux transporter outer membrane subunit [Candidatus Methylobacter oryzae]